MAMVMGKFTKNTASPKVTPAMDERSIQAPTVIAVVVGG
jgi:hypothetical protein